MISICYTVDAGFLGGAEHYVSRLATNLDRREFRPSVLLRAGTGDGALEAWASELERVGVPVRRIPMRLPGHPGDAVAVLDAFREVRPDIVHVNMPGPYDGQNGLLVPIARLSGARTVVTEHLPMVERRWKRALLKRVAFRWLDMGVTVSEANRAYLVGRQGVPPHKVRMVRNGVPCSFGQEAGDSDPMRRRLGLRTESVAVVYVGNILMHKGLCDVIEALSQCPGGVWDLVVIGSGPDEARARDRARTLGVADRTHFLGRLPPLDVEAALPAFDILTLPSRIEGLPYTVIEAMACSLPVVATPVFGIPEAVVDGETGFLVPPGDIEALAHALRSLIGDATLRQRLGQAGRARFESLFTLERQVREMEALYLQLYARMG